MTRLKELGLLLELHEPSWRLPEGLPQKLTQTADSKWRRLEALGLG
jgi:hypothetical protein